MTIFDTPGIVISQSGDGTRQVRSALQVDEIEDPIEAAKDVCAKVEKVELLRHYRIGNFENIDQLLENLAIKKGLVTTEKVEVEKKVAKLVPAGGRKMKKTNEIAKVVTETKQIPNKPDAARRLIRDFLNNKL